MSKKPSCACFPALFLAVLVAGPAPAGEPKAPPAAAAPAGAESEEAFRRRMRKETSFGFEENICIAPDSPPLPAEWERYVDYSETPEVPAGSARETLLPAQGLGGKPVHYFGRFPDFLPIEVLDLKRRGTPPEAVHGGQRAIRMSLAGSQGMDHVAIRRKVPLDADADFAYEITAWVRLENARKTGAEASYAQVWVEWLDAEGRRLGEPLASDAVKGGASGWVKLPEFRINEVDPLARAMRLWCVGCGRESGAWAGFDDLEVHRRPKVSAEPVSRAPDPQGNCGIFEADEVPTLKLSFQGLGSGAAGGRAAAERYLRVITIEDLFGRRLPVLERPFEPVESRGGSLEERARLEVITEPGVYSVQVELQALRPNGARAVEAKRVIRVARLAKSSGARDETARQAFGVDLDLYRPEAPRLIEAAGQLGVFVLAPRLWRAAADPARPAAAAEAAPEDLLERRLRELAGARRMYLYGELSPVPRKLTEARDYENPGSLLKDQPEAWQALMRGTVAAFGPYLTGWRAAAPDEAGFAALPPDERPALAARALREAFLERAASKLVILPVPLGKLPAPAPRLTAANYRELVCVPAGEGSGPQSLEQQLRRLFPREEAAAGQDSPAGEKGGREWFVQLEEVSDNLTLDLREERRQVEDLARKVTLLAAAGAGRFFVELAHPRRGLLGPGLYPRPAYAAYRTLAEHLAGARFLGSFDLAPGTFAWAFERGEEGLIVFWTDGPEREAACQLGDRGDAELVDLAGRAHRLRAPRNDEEANGLFEAEMVPLGRLPAIITRLKPEFIRTRLAFRLAEGSRLQSRYEPQTIRFEIRNYFSTPMRARIFPRFPQGTVATPKFQRVNLEPGERAEVAFSVRPSFIATTDNQELAVDLHLEAAKRQVAFTVRRQLPMESDLKLEAILPQDKRNPDGRTVDVQVHVALRAPEQAGPAAPRRRADVEVSLTVPGRARQRAMLYGLEPGKSSGLDAPFQVPLGDRKQTVYVGARERGGQSFANIEIELPAAKR